MPHRLQNPKERLEKKEKENKDFLVATNNVASRPPERQPTGIPTARANFKSLGGLEVVKFIQWCLT